MDFVSWPLFNNPSENKQLPLEQQQPRVCIALWIFGSFWKFLTFASPRSSWPLHVDHAAWTCNAEEFSILWRVPVHKREYTLLSLYMVHSQFAQRQSRFISLSCWADAPHVVIKKFCCGHFSNERASTVIKEKQVGGKSRTWQPYCGIEDSHCCVLIFKAVACETVATFSTCALSVCFLGFRAETFPKVLILQGIVAPFPYGLSLDVFVDTADSAVEVYSFKNGQKRL